MQRGRRKLAGVARAGDAYENPATGDRIVFLRTGAETNGELVEYEVEYTPRGFATREHVHPEQEERHEMLEGALGLVVAGRELRLGPGDVEIVPPGTPHNVFRVGEDRVKARFTSRPALDTDELLETFMALALAGKVNAEGNPNILQLAVIARAFERLGYPTRPPLAVQRVLLGPLAVLGRLLGYRARHDPRTARVTG